MALRERISQMTTADLEAEDDRLDGHDCSFEDDCADCLRHQKVTRELEARELWDHEDGRVRESVGNYR